MNKLLEKSVYKNYSKVLLSDKNFQIFALSFSNIHSNSEKVLNIENLNPNILKLQYAVKGKIVIKANEIENELKAGVKKSFDKVIKANIGDCHATGQKPLTFLRQLMAVCALPDLLNDSRFPEDVKKRAKRILSSCNGNSIGSYTDSNGLEVVRSDVANFLQKRDDGISSNVNDIYLISGASEGIKEIIKLIVNNREKKTGLLIPIPQYPFYSATIAEYDACEIGYYLDEDKNWGMNIQELERAYNDSLTKCEPKAICILNPGNPTGQVLSRNDIENIIRWAHKKKLFILADEVYQDNIYVDGAKFHSFKKVACQMGPPYSNIEIVSFYSTSKGYMGECGIRGAFMEAFNLDPKVQAQLDKLMTIRLCSSVTGQACLDGIVNPPTENEPSYEKFIQEKNLILNRLKEKADLVTSLFNQTEGVQCNTVQGAMYAFPKITIPKKAIDKATSLNMKPDEFYCFQLLENTGICVIPGSGFLQRPGTYHFRTTILPPVDEIKSLLARFKQFHVKFLKQWA